jgi:hypothetical protein
MEDIKGISGSFASSPIERLVQLGGFTGIEVAFCYHLEESSRVTTSPDNGFVYDKVADRRIVLPTWGIIPAERKH